MVPWLRLPTIAFHWEWIVGRHPAAVVPENFSEVSSMLERMATAHAGALPAPVLEGVAAQLALLHHLD